MTEHDSDRDPPILVPFPPCEGWDQSKLRPYQWRADWSRAGA
jgi:hypothetical protein